MAALDKVPSISQTAFTPSDVSSDPPKKGWHRVKEVVWDSFDHSPEERRFISKIDFFILTWAGLSYFSKNLNQGNLSNAYVSGM